jgi:hypothetical protein
MYALEDNFAFSLVMGNLIMYALVKLFILCMHVLLGGFAFLLEIH